MKYSFGPLTYGAIEISSMEQGAAVSRAQYPIPRVPCFNTRAAMNKLRLPTMRCLQKCPECMVKRAHVFFYVCTLYFIVNFQLVTEQNVNMARLTNSKRLYLQVITFFLGYWVHFHEGALFEHQLHCKTLPFCTLTLVNIFYRHLVKEWTKKINISRPSFFLISQLVLSTSDYRVRQMGKQSFVYSSCHTPQ